MPKDSARLCLDPEAWSPDLAKQYGLPEGWLARQYRTSVRFRNGLEGKVLKNYTAVEEELGFRPQNQKPDVQKAQPEEFSKEIAQMWGLPEPWVAKRYADGRLSFKKGPHGAQMKGVQELAKALGYMPKKVEKEVEKEKPDLWSEELAREYSLPDGWVARRHYDNSLRFRHGRDGNIFHGLTEVSKEVGFQVQKKGLADVWSAELATEHGLPDGWLVRTSATRRSTTPRFKRSDTGKTYHTVAELAKEIGYLPKAFDHKSGSKRIKLSLDTAGAGDIDTDTEIQETRCDEQIGPHSYSLQLCRQGAAWVVLPSDVLNLNLELISARIEAAGFTRAGESEHRCSFTGHVDFTIYADGGKLVVRSRDKQVVQEMSTLLVEGWLVQEDG